MAKKLVKFMCTAFRDGFQSCFGARVFTKDFMPAVEAARDAGITWFEAGGGARFQSLYFYGNECAYEMMDQFRKVTGPDADLQTLARGVNIVGLDSQPRDIIKLHAKMFKKHGISTIRNFDALNDVNNLIDSGQAIHDAGLKHQVTVTMMSLPPDCTGAHDPDFYERILKGILDAHIPFDSVCFKDASGTSTPATVFETMKRARKLLGDKVMINFHSHETAGCCVACYLAALDGGADAIDLSMAPVSGGTCQVDILTMWHALRGSDKYDLGIDPNKIRKAEDVFKKCMSTYPSKPEALAVEPLIPWSPLPGGALTANTEMLRDNGLMDKYMDCLLAMNDVVRKGGFATSVTPVSQFYFQQAFNNVMFGPWKKIAEGYGKMVLGYFGKTPCAPDPEVVKIAAEQLGMQPTTEKVVDINDRDPKKGVEAAKKMLTDGGITDLSDENIFIAATCKEKGILYLQGKAKPNIRKIDPNAPKGGSGAGGGDGSYAVTVGGKSFTVAIAGNKATVNGKSYDIDVKAGAAAPAAAGASSAGATEVKAPMPGLILRINVSEGASVNAGDEILVLEAMKMETPIKAAAAGTVKSISVKQGDQVTAGQVLVTMG